MVVTSPVTKARSGAAAVGFQSPSQQVRRVATIAATAWRSVAVSPSAAWLRFVPVTVSICSSDIYIHRLHRFAHLIFSTARATMAHCDTTMVVSVDPVALEIDCSKDPAEPSQVLGVTSHSASESDLICKTSELSVHLLLVSICLFRFLYYYWRNRYILQEQCINIQHMVVELKTTIEALMYEGHKKRNNLVPPRRSAAACCHDFEAVGRLGGRAA